MANPDMSALLEHDELGTWNSRGNGAWAVPNRSSSTEITRVGTDRRRPPHE
jgi:hypothetical protein